MGDRTGIQWTDSTWNPVRGCSRVSPGCERCYAEAMAGRFCGPGQPYHGLVKLNGGRGAGKRAKWTGVVRLTPLTQRRWGRRFGWTGAPPLQTEIDPAKVRRKRDPGRCFRRAGWREIDRRRGLVILEAPELDA